MRDLLFQTRVDRCHALQHLRPRRRRLRIIGKCRWEARIACTELVFESCIGCRSVRGQGCGSVLPRDGTETKAPPKFCQFFRRRQCCLVSQRAHFGAISRYSTLGRRRIRLVDNLLLFRLSEQQDAILDEQQRLQRENIGRPRLLISTVG